MENATKAFLIAAGVLIAILMIASGVYLYSLFSKQSKEYTETISAVEVEKFNSKFNVYVGRTDITAQEIVSVVNLAKEYGDRIMIHLDGSPLQFTKDYTQEDFLEIKQDKKFSCKLSNENPKYGNDGRINELKFKEN